jgi:putative ABC transport system permease protein
MITELLTRARFFFARNVFLRKTRSEMDEELRFHLEQSVAQKVAAGMAEGEARRQALVEFGGVEATRERIELERPGWWMPGVAGDVRYAVRGILAHGWFSAAIVGTLALGIGLNTMVFTLVNAALFKPVPVPGGERLVSVMSNDRAQNSRGEGISYPDFEDMKAQSTLFESFEAVEYSRAILAENGTAPEEYHMGRATVGIFGMVQAKPVLGRGFLAGDDKPGAAPVMVIAYNVFKERYAGDAGVVGRQVRVNGQPATIVGVMPEGFHFPTGFDVWMPLTPTADLEKRDARPLWGYAILKPGTPVLAANAELNSIADRLAGRFPEDKEIGASALSFLQRFNGGNIRMVFLLMLAAVGFVLLIACADVANMMLSRSLSRQREMSIRSALGATRWRIVRQLLIESVMLSTVGGLAGLGLAWGGVRWFDLATKDIRPYWIQFTTDFTVFGYFAALCILSGLLFGIAPALRSSKPDLMGVLKEGARSVGRRRGGWLTGGLVVFQFALTLALLTGAGIFVESLMSNLAVNPFIPATRIMTARASLPDTRYKDDDAREKFFDRVLPALGAIPGAAHAAASSEVPGVGAAWRPMEREHATEKPEHRPTISEVVVSPGYFDAIHLPILRGRGFDEQDGSAHREAAVVTREAANKLWPGQDAVGKRFRLIGDDKKPTEWITVVGISGDIVQELVENDPKPLVFVPYRMERYTSMALMVEMQGDARPDSLAAMRKAVASVDPELPLSEPFRLDAAVTHQVWFLRVFGRVFSGFALIAMLMAAVGLYSVIAHATASRTQEIGVRIALGARVKDILLLVMRRGLLQVAAGLMVGMGAALALAKLMANLPLGGTRQMWMIFPVVAGLLALVGVFACWLPAQRAAGLDPVKAIRCE